MRRIHEKCMNSRSWFGSVYRTLYMVAGLDIPAYAANAAYFIIMAALPTILLLLALLRYTSLDSGVLIQALDAFVPEALTPLITKLVNSLYDSSSTVLVSVSALAAVWSASRGIYGIIKGLNRIYAVRENRGYVYTRLMSVLYMVLFIVILILTLAIHVFGQTIAQQIPVAHHPVILLLDRILPVRFFVLLLLQTLVFTAMFMTLPNRKNRLLTSLPGAVFASLGWLIFSDLFSIYVDHFSNYPAIYGSLSAVALAMLWLYICMAILFYGGALNKWLMDMGYILRRKKKRKETPAVPAEQEPEGKSEA